MQRSVVSILKSKILQMRMKIICIFYEVGELIIMSKCDKSGLTLSNGNDNYVS